ncbi:LysR family transcriptional regulator [Halomonas cupida]|uniref:DNA-binding transcriptional regulator, LysR family n=1 Tax=Halomonas cupida TaxID=44933 RepID=A0A1M7JTR2_9GAMM|nr:LysR family transcriptional regulator [Halomonas cupida]GEN24482.1 LysR family transcriptional regulator [Halomonas cupida]SHM56384.1 DNA-binding transcriptional regulator, LysR family [Halomonas cupida]
MQSIDHFDLRNFDLNLLIAFDAMMRERSVTRAAERLKIRQPAMSHNLSLLRTLFQDELFVRVGTVMQPTMRAQLLAEPVEQALGMMQAVIHATSEFDPMTDQRIFRMGFSSEVELLLMPELASRLRQRAPGVRLHGRPVQQRDVYRMLDDRILNLAIGCFDSQAQRYRQQPLFEQSLSCVFHPDMMALGESISLEEYLSLPHSVVSLSESLHGCLEAALDAVGGKLNVVATSSEFLGVLGMAASAPLIATLPTRMARRYGEAFGLRVVPVPMTLTVPDVSLIWTAQEDNHPASQWLRSEIADILGRMDVPW